MKKGRLIECSVSSRIHAKGVVLLIDPYFLRSKNMGQVDLAIILERHLIIIECKSNCYLSSNQRVRLMRSGMTLSRKLKIPFELFLYSKQDKSLYPVNQF